MNEPRIASKEKFEQGSLFDVWKGDEGNTFEDGWKNKLIWGDNKFVMSSLLENYAGKIDLIYIDPPFATGADFKMNVEIGDSENTLYKEPENLNDKKAIFRSLCLRYSFGDTRMEPLFIFILTKD